MRGGSVFLKWGTTPAERNRRLNCPPQYRVYHAAESIYDRAPVVLQRVEFDADDPSQYEIVAITADFIGRLGIVAKI